MTKAEELLPIQLRATVEHIRKCPEYKNLGGDADNIEAAAALIEQWNRRALAKPAGEAVAWMYDVARDGFNDCTCSMSDVVRWPEQSKIVPLYIRPAEDARDAERLEWCLPILTGSDDKSTDMKAMQLAQALMQGLTDREAIDAARRGRP